MRLRAWTNGSLGATTFMLIVLVPAVESQAPRILIEDAEGDVPVPQLDILRLDLVGGVGSELGLRLVMNEATAPPAGPNGNLGQVDYQYSVYFQLDRPSTGSDSWEPITVRLIASNDPTNDASTWRFRAARMLAPLDSQTERELRVGTENWRDGIVAGRVEAATYTWNFDVQTLVSDLWTSAVPSGMLNLTKVFVEARIHEPATETNLGTRYGLWPYETVRDRAPAQGYGHSTQVSVEGTVVVDPAREPVVFFGKSIPSNVAVTAVLALIGVAGLVAYGIWRWIWPIFVPLFTRIETDEALDHPRRAMIHEAIRLTPGITFGALRRDLGIGSGAIAHHLAILEQQGLVKARRVGRRRVFVVAGHAGQIPDEPTSQQAILLAVKQSPGMDAQELARRTGLTRSTIVYHLSILGRSHLVQRETAGKKIRFFPV